MTQCFYHAYDIMGSGVLFSIEQENETQSELNGSYLNVLLFCDEETRNFNCFVSGYLIDLSLIKELLVCCIHTE